MRPTNRLLAFTFLILCSLLLPAGYAATTEAEGFHDITMSPKRDLQAEARGELRSDAKELVQLLDIASMVARLRAAKQGGADSAHLSRPLQNARLLCLWKIFIASEEVRKAVAMTNFDLSKSNESLDALAARRDMTLDMLNTFNFMQGGTLGTIKQSLSLPGRTQAPASARQEIAMTSFGTSLILATAGLFVPSLYTSKIDGQPNVLAYVLNPAVRPADADQSYVWKFMNSPIPGSNVALTRREILLKHFEDLGRLDLDDQRNLNKLSATTDPSGQLRAGIRTLQQRMNLLHDLRAHLEEIDGGLYEVQQAITFN